MARSKTRRSFVANEAQEDDLSQEDLNEDEHTDELQTRRSITKADRGAVFKRPAPPTASTGAARDCNQDFFHCLKLAAENKISSKNAFGLQMIDILGEQVAQKDSFISKNFQLASCSLDAGTKIFAARVDCLAKETDILQMVMSKKGGNGEEPDDDEAPGDNEEDVVQAKKKRIKKLRRNQVFAKDYKDLQMDLTKIHRANSLFPILGNLMNEDINSFNFTERSEQGATEQLLPSKLERSEPNTLMKIHLQQLTKEMSLCPTLEKFALEFDLSENANELFNSSAASLSGSPLISLRDFNESSLEDNPPPEPDNNFFDGTIVEEVAACHQGFVDRSPSMVADRSVATLSSVPLGMVNSGRMIQLQGPAFWKWKKPSFPNQMAKAAVKKRVKPKHEPINFTVQIDLTNLLKKKTRLGLQRETLLRWSTSKITLPFEVSELDPDSFESNMDITKGILIPQIAILGMEKVFAPASGNTVQDDAAPREDFFNDEHFPIDNPLEDVNQNDDSDDDHAEPILGDEESFNLDLENLFKNSNLNNASGRASYMTYIGLDESNLISAPQMVDTVIPEWKPAKRFNMKKLEAFLWDQIHVDKDGEVVDTQPDFHELYQNLPQKLRDSASATTVYYALLNVANKKGITIRSKNLFDCQVEHLANIPGNAMPHPATEMTSFGE